MIAVPEFIKPFLNIESIFVICGGLLISSGIFLTIDDIKNLPRLGKKAFSKNTGSDKPEEIIKQLITLAKEAHISGKRHININYKDINPFLKRAANMIIDHFGDDYIRNTLENDIIEMRRRHNIMIDYFNTLGALSPMFGLLGTVLGIILLLKNINDVAKIGVSMSLAMNNTLYGILFAAMIFLPIAKKLENMSEREAQLKEMIMDGILMIEREEAPSKVEKYLAGYLKADHKKSA